MLCTFANYMAFCSPKLEAAQACLSKGGWGCYVLWDGANVFWGHPGQGMNESSAPSFVLHDHRMPGS